MNRGDSVYGSAIFGDGERGEREKGGEGSLSLLRYLHLVFAYSVFGIAGRNGPGSNRAIQLPTPTQTTLMGLRLGF